MQYPALNLRQAIIDYLETHPWAYGELLYG